MRIDVVNMSKHPIFQIPVVALLFSLILNSSTCLRGYLRKASHPSLHLIAAYAKPPGSKPVPCQFAAPTFRDRNLWLWGQKVLLTK